MWPMISRWMRNARTRFTNSFTCGNSGGRQDREQEGRTAAGRTGEGVSSRSCLLILHSTCSKMHKWEKQTVTGVGNLLGPA